MGGIWNTLKACNQELMKELCDLLEKDSIFISMMHFSGSYRIISERVPLHGFNYKGDYNSGGTDFGQAFNGIERLMNLSNPSTDVPIVLFFTDGHSDDRPAIEKAK